MNRFTGLLTAAAAVATMVGFATPGEARDWRQGNRCDWVYNDQGNHGFQYRGQWQQYRFDNLGFGWRQHQLGPRQIRWALYRQGFYRIHDIEYRRGIYRAVAVGRHGRPLQVFASPVNGQVLCVSQIRHQGRGYRNTVRRGRDRDFAQNRDRRADRNRNTVRRSHDRDFAQNRDRRADRNRNTVRRGHDRDFAQNRDRRTDRNRNTVRRGRDRDFAQNRDRRTARNRDRNRR